jgi:hypothetical protein
MDARRLPTLGGPRSLLNTIFWVIPTEAFMCRAGPKMARNGPLRVYLSEHLLSVVQKTLLVFPIPHSAEPKRILSNHPKTELASPFTGKRGWAGCLSQQPRQLLQAALSFDL